jgi:hypothetical protein
MCIFQECVFRMDVCLYHRSSCNNSTLDEIVFIKYGIQIPKETTFKMLILSSN